MNAVGVDLNTASAPLLARVSGLGPSLAEAIVAHRDENGAFRNRKELLKVRAPRAAHLRAVRGLPAHPRRRASRSTPRRCTRKPMTSRAKIVAACGRDLRALMGDSAALKALDPREFVDERFGLPTVRDILAELEKPGRDPRPGFKTATFAEGVDDIKDLKPGMMLEGTVTNVAAFGAFVDIGVHQDGLVHVSPARRPLREGPARGGEGRRRGEGARGRGGRAAQAHRPDHAQGLGRGAGAGAAERGSAKDRTPTRGSASAGPKGGASGGNSFADALKDKFGK